MSIHVSVKGIIEPSKATRCFTVLKRHVRVDRIYKDGRCECIAIITLGRYHEETVRISKEEASRVESVLLGYHFDKEEILGGFEFDAKWRRFYGSIRGWFHVKDLLHKGEVPESLLFLGETKHVVGRKLSDLCDHGTYGIIRKKDSTGKTYRYRFVKGSSKDSFNKLKVASSKKIEGE